jgi:hypothetical protein
MRTGEEIEEGNTRKKINPFLPITEEHRSNLSQVFVTCILEYPDQTKEAPIHTLLSKNSRLTLKRAPVFYCCTFQAIPYLSL